MHSVVRSFRAVFVEGRSVLFLAVLGMIGMRAALFSMNQLPRAIASKDNFLWEPIAPLFSEPFVSLIAATFFVFLIAWLLTLINARFNLIRSRSNLPFIVPLFLLSLHPYFLVMTGNYISIVFILLAIFPILESYQKTESYLCSFRASILIAVSSLFQIYALLILPLWWVGERSMRGNQFRSLLSSLFGLFLVYLTLFSIYWMLDNIPRFLTPFQYFISISVDKIPSLSILEWCGLFFVFLFFIFNIFFSISIYIRDKALTLSLMRFVNFLTIFSLLFSVLYWQETHFFLLLALTLVSFLNAYFFSKTVSKNHIYLAYGMLTLMVIFFLSHFHSSVKTLF